MSADRVKPTLSMLHVVKTRAHLLDCDAHHYEGATAEGYEGHDPEDRHSPFLNGVTMSTGTWHSLQVLSGHATMPSVISSEIWKSGLTS